MKLTMVIMFSFLSISCNSHKKKVSPDIITDLIKKETETQIGDYVTGAYEDAKGNLWFGTLAKGIALYDGNNLKYFTKFDGLLSDRVTGITEDTNGIIWLQTGVGLSRYDGKSFTNFPIKEDDFYSNVVSQLLIDSKGRFWIGTWGGVYIFDGVEFHHFPIPKPQMETIINEDTKNWITAIEEDSAGHIWFGRDGYGACQYNGESFKHYSIKDGLHSNNITDIEFGKEGDIWFGTRVAEKDSPDPTKRSGKGGVNKMTKTGISSFLEIDAFNNGDVYEIYADIAKNVWISTTKNGVYRYDGKEFKHYEVPISIMSMTNDHLGNLWLAGAGGLYKINQNEEIINITTKGPWQ